MTQTAVPFVDLKAQFGSLRAEMNASITSVLESAHFVAGPALEQFESEFAKFVDARFCVGVGNGTDAITLAAKSAEIGPGDEVLVPANTFFATAEAFANAGAKPVFVDVDPDTFHMDPAEAAAAITPRTRAIAPVHLYGRPVDMRPFEELASRHNLVIIEDCAQAHGASIGGRVVGSSGRLTCFSFYPGKNLGAYGDGGAVTTSDAHLAARLRILRDHGSPSKYTHSMVGYNSRLDALQASVLSVKLPRLNGWNASRGKHARVLAAALANTAIVPPRIEDSHRHVFHLFVVRCSMRDNLRQFLAERGIQTGIHYPVPLHLTEAFQALGAPGPGAMPIAEALAREILSLPMYAELTDTQLSLIVSAINEFIDAYKPAFPTEFPIAAQAAF